MNTVPEYKFRLLPPSVLTNKISCHLGIISHLADFTQLEQGVYMVRMSVEHRLQAKETGKMGEEEEKRLTKESLCFHCVLAHTNGVRVKGLNSLPE